ncbi:hypothetical protein EDB85DRAFT_2157332 [Lactarius pseudohatsudake]|nr:hypothetical protein EDB85DRAFT_2157332 [Lactarius pseudohatsudake]
MNALLEAAGGGDSFEPLDDDPTLVPGSPGEDNGNEDLDEPERAALACGLSNSSATRSRLERPPIPRFAPRRSVRDRFRPLATAQLCSPFPTSPHLRAAFTLQHQRTRNCRRPAYKVSRRADACATVCDHSQSTDLAPLPNLAALVRSTIPSTATRLRPPRTYIRRLAPCGGLRDRLRRFTPPNPAQP